MADYLTDTWSLLRSVKSNLMEYRGFTDSLQIGKGQINWGLGFITKQTVFPAITVFPLSKTFGPRRGSGRCIVDYRFSVDIYSPRKVKPEEAKEWALKAAEDVKTCLRGAVTMPDSTGKKHCFSTSVLGVSISEQLDPAGKDFQSVASVRMSCLAYHDPNLDRESAFTPGQTNSDDFINRVYKLTQKNAVGMERVRSWGHKVARVSAFSPEVLILQGDETYNDQWAGNTDQLSRPLVFSVISRDYPKAATLEEVIGLADKLVAAIEKGYKVEGYADDCVVSTISYDWSVDGEIFQFIAAVQAEYLCQHTIGRILH